MNYDQFFVHVKKVIQLSRADEDFIASKLHSRVFQKGQFIVQAGDIYEYQSFLLSGKVRTYYLDQVGHEHVVAFGIENWWVGDLCSFSNQEPAEFNTECLATTTALQFSHADMNALYEKVPQLERYFRIIIQKAYGNMSKRLVRNHAMIAKDRYKLFLKSYPEMAERYPNYMIASYLGITKEFLSNIRKEIAREP